MTNLRRRIRKLEAYLTDASGLVPHTPAWMNYWMQELKTVVESDPPVPGKLVPLEVARAYMQAGDEDGIVRTTPYQ